MAIPRTSGGIPWLFAGIPAPNMAGGSTPPPVADPVRVLVLYGSVAADGTIPAPSTPFQQMRLADTGNEGFSQYRDIINSMVGPTGERYSITEMYDMDFDPAIHLVGVTVLILLSSQRVFTTQERDAIFAWGEDGPRGLIGISDSALGGGPGAAGGGYQNQVGQTARASIFNPYLQVLVDQVDGAKTWTIPAAHPISGGSNLVWEGEGHSPCRLNPLEIAVSIIDYDDQTPNHTQGITAPYDGIHSILASIENGSFRLLYIGDRNWGWNAGAGSNINEFQNAAFAQNSIQWAAHYR